MDEIISYKMCAVKVRNAKLRNYLKLKGHFCPLAPPGKGQRGRLPLLPPQFRRPWVLLSAFSFSYFVKAKFGAFVRILI
jgi:hypothetical protein